MVTSVQSGNPYLGGLYAQAAAMRTKLSELIRDMVAEAALVVRQQALLAAASRRQGAVGPAMHASSATLSPPSAQPKARTQTKTRSNTKTIAAKPVVKITGAVKGSGKDAATKLKTTLAAKAVKTKTTIGKAPKAAAAPVNKKAGTSLGEKEAGLAKNKPMTKPKTKSMPTSAKTP